MHALIHICHVLHNKTFSKNHTILLEGIKSANDEIIKKIAPSNPNWLEFWTFQGIWSHKIGKGSGIVKLDMASEKIPRMEELESGQQEM